MRTVLWFAVGLLLMVVVLNREAERERSRRVAEMGGDRLEFLLFSTGRQLEMPRYGDLPVNVGVFVGNRRLDATPIAQPGLRAVAVTSTGRTVHSSINHWRGRGGQLDALAEVVRGLPNDTVIALAQYGTMMRPGGADPGELDRFGQLLLELGGQSGAIAATQTSFAFLAIRREGGWIPLAEACSWRRGVRLGFTVEPGWSRYDGAIPALAEENLATEGLAPRDVPLVTRYRRARSGLGHTLLLPSIDLGGQSKPGFLTRPPTGESLAHYPHGENRLRFEDVVLGPAPRLRGFYGSSAEPGKGDGVILSIRVDDRVVAEWTLSPDDNRVWRPFAIDLGEFADRTVTAIELRVGPRGSPAHDDACWGDLILEWDATIEVPRGEVGGLPVGLAAMRLQPGTRLAGSASSSYRFLCAGHAYGSETDVVPGLFAPFAEALSREPDLDALAFVVLTGDAVYAVTETHFDALDRDVDRLGRPVFVAPGNHDTKWSTGADGARTDPFTERYGARRTDFWIGEDAFLVCDTPDGRGGVAPADLERLDEILREEPRALFLFVHHLVWIDRERMREDPALAFQLNGVSGYPERGRFWDDALRKLDASDALVFVVAGDVGSGSSQVVESYTRAADNVHLIASGMGRHPDVGTYLAVTVGDDGVRFSTRRLGEGTTVHLQGVARIPAELFPFGER